MPGTKKKKLLYNGYKDKAKRVCRYCGQSYAERHEVFGGSNRQTSIRHGFQVDVCGEHHRELQENITEWAQEENRNLRSGYQREYMDKLIDSGVTERDALRTWMWLIGRNYIEELMPE